MSLLLDLTPTGSHKDKHVLHIEIKIYGRLIRAFKKDGGCKKFTQE
jgi:hypothetical protein